MAESADVQTIDLTNPLEGEYLFALVVEVIFETLVSDLDQGVNNSHQILIVVVNALSKYAIQTLIQNLNIVLTFLHKRSSILRQQILVVV